MCPLAACSCGARTPLGAPLGGWLPPSGGGRCTGGPSPYAPPRVLLPCRRSTYPRTTLARPLVSTPCSSYRMLQGCTRILASDNDQQTPTSENSVKAKFAESPKGEVHAGVKVCIAPPR